MSGTFTYQFENENKVFQVHFFFFLTWSWRCSEIKLHHQSQIHLLIHILLTVLRYSVGSKKYFPTCSLQRMLG